jgi:DNA processing protein
MDSSVPKHEENGPIAAAISPRRELGAYEALWLRETASFKTLADTFAAHPTALPSDFISLAEADKCATEVMRILKDAGAHRFGIRVNHAGDYPTKLRDARHPIELLYFQGTWELAESRCVAVVGSRIPTEEGKQRAARLARKLVEKDFTVVSGLAAGIDTAAHTAAIAATGGRTIAVIGTPLGKCYPPANKELQDRIAREFLLVSQVPVLRYREQDYRLNRFFFPERNVTMSALTEATIIVEASDTSGSLTQARAALQQGRKLFILDSCFARKDLKWPAAYERRGAIRVREAEDIWKALG